MGTAAAAGSIWSRARESFDRRGAVAYIKHPERTKPGIEMPTWDGVIGEDEYAPLATYVRSLAARRAWTALGEIVD